MAELELHEHAFRFEAVDVDKVRSFQTPKCATHDLDDEDEPDGPSGILSVDDIPTTLAPGRDEAAVKMVMRNHNHDFKNPLRPHTWKALYLRLEAIAGTTTDPLNAQSLADATANLYQDTLQTCFGTQGQLNKNISKQKLLHITDVPLRVSLSPWTSALYDVGSMTTKHFSDISNIDEIGLPGCIDPNHTNSYYLGSAGKTSVARILTCFAYNQPDLQYCPILYSIAAVLRHYLSGLKVVTFPLLPFSY